MHALTAANAAASRNAGAPSALSSTPVPTRRAYLRENVKGTDKAAYKRAERVMNRLLTQVDDQRSVTSSVTMGYALDEWLRTSEVEDSTRDGYVNYISRYIKPVLGEQPVRKIDAHTLESFYTELRRCRTTPQIVLVRPAGLRS